METLEKITRGVNARLLDKLNRGFDMFAFPSMLFSACDKAGIKHPKDADNYDADEYPHFHVFCKLQLGRRMQIGEHWENAKVIASIPEDEIRTITLPEILAKGFEM